MRKNIKRERNGERTVWQSERVEESALSWGVACSLVPSRSFYFFQNLARLPRMGSLNLSRSNSNDISLDSWAGYLRSAIPPLELVMLSFER
jgi:hypothetical protein